MTVFDGLGNLRQDRMRGAPMDAGAYEEPEDEDLFTNRPPTPHQAATLDAITEAMLEAHGTLLMLLPPSRFRSTATRKLEECSMWAKKATVFTVHGESSSAQQAGLTGSETDVDPANPPVNVRPHRPGSPPEPLAADPRSLP